MNVVCCSYLKMKKKKYKGKTTETELYKGKIYFFYILKKKTEYK